ncbi:hypothetical protein C8J57DRAFT_1509917 [Mycena rebaudengoi]|nr:hypothetical protein C8J57DRAFT_1509917 [Mycena rebaudengoi]
MPGSAPTISREITFPLPPQRPRVKLLPTTAALRHYTIELVDYETTAIFLAVKIVPAVLRLIVIDLKTGTSTELLAVGLRGEPQFAQDAPKFLVN